MAEDEKRREIKDWEAEGSGIGGGLKDWFEENTSRMVRETVASDFKDTDFKFERAPDMSDKTIFAGKTTNFCTPVVINAGFIIDPTAALISAKQLSNSLTRNVLLRIELDLKGTIICYYIQPGQHMAEVTAIEVRYNGGSSVNVISP